MRGEFTGMLGKLLDDKTRMLYLLASLVGVAVILAAGMMVSTKLGGGQMAVESEAATQAPTDAIAVDGVNVEASDEYAAALFACKVDDMHNSAAVATLLTVMDIEKVTGKYAVHIAEKDGAQALTLTTELPVMSGDASAFNANMKKRAQQMLVLIPQLDKVEWIYSVKSAEGETQEAGSVDDAAVAEELGKTSEDYGKSERTFGKLLAQQAK